MNETENRVKYFTPAEANKTLPLVKPIVQDILDAGKRVRDLRAALGHDDDNHPEVQTQLNQLASYFAELEQIGCVYKDWDFSVGLVDFPGIIENQEVLLCWRSDEPALMYYHEAEAGYAGRKPIPAEYMK